MKMDLIFVAGLALGLGLCSRTFACVFVLRRCRPRPKCLGVKWHKAVTDITIQMSPNSLSIFKSSKCYHVCFWCILKEVLQSFPQMNLDVVLLRGQRKPRSTSSSAAGELRQHLAELFDEESRSTWGSRRNPFALAPAQWDEQRSCGAMKLVQKYPHLASEPQLRHIKTKKPFTVCRCPYHLGPSHFKQKRTHGVALIFLQLNTFLVGCHNARCKSDRDSA